MKKRITCIAKARDISGKKMSREYAIQSASHEELLELLYAHEKSLGYGQKSEFLSEDLQKEYLRYKANV